jgi:hypothetical protein
MKWRGWEGYIATFTWWFVREKNERHHFLFGEVLRLGSLFHFSFRWTVTTQTFVFVTPNHSRYSASYILYIYKTVSAATTNLQERNSVPPIFNLAMYFPWWIVVFLVGRFVSRWVVLG